MNKKFFSAVLMGALLLGGTFVSCQDYDDDIENLQNQIDKLASSSDLSAQVSSLEGKISAAQSAAEAKAAAANTVAEAAKNAAGTAQSAADAAKTAADKVAADLTAANTDLAGKVAAAQTAAEAKAAELVDAAKAAANDEIAKAVAAAQAAQETADAAKADAKAAADALATAKAELAAAAEDDKTEAKAGVTEAKQAAAVAKAAADSAQVTADKAKEAAEALALKLAETDANVAKALADAKAANDALAELQSKVAANEEAIALAQEAADKAKALAEKAADKAEVEEALNAIKEEAEAQAAKVTALEAAVEAINAALKNKLEEGDLAGLQSQIDELRKDVKLLTGADPIEVVSVNAPAGLVKVGFMYAQWKNVTKLTDVELVKELKAEYPDAPWINYEKNQLVKQGGQLPVIVNPADVKLNDKFDFALQTMDGEEFDVTFDTPVQGLVGADVLVSTPSSPTEEGYIIGMETKAVDANAAVWTLGITPAKEKNGKAYKEIAGTKLASLVVETASGSVLRTPYAYQVIAKRSADVDIDVHSATYAPSIDLLKKDVKEGLVPVEITGGFDGYQIIELTSKYERTLYGLDIVDNHILTIKNMPAGVNKIEIHVRVVALGLNGSVLEKKGTLEIKQTIEGNSSLGLCVDTLTGKSQIARWDINDLGIADDIIAMDKVANMFQASVNKIGEDGELTGKKFEVQRVYLNAKGEETEYSGHEWSNEEPAFIGIKYDASATPSDLTKFDYVDDAEYAVTFAAVDDDETTLYSATATLETVLPELTEDFIEVASAYKEGKDTVRVISNIPADNNNNLLTSVEFTDANLKATFVKKAVDFVNIKDAVYDTENAADLSASNPAKYNYYPSGVKVNPWRYSYAEGFVAAKDNQMYNYRPMVAEVKLWGNPNLTTDYNFTMVVKSSVWSDTPSSVITFKKDTQNKTTKKDINYGGTASYEIEKAIFAAGQKKGQTYNLFGNGETVSDATYKAKMKSNFESPKVNGANNYVVDSSNGPVEIESADFLTFGMDFDTWMAYNDLAAAKQKKVYLTGENYHAFVKVQDGEMDVKYSTETSEVGYVKLVNWKDITNVAFGRVKVSNDNTISAVLVANQATMAFYKYVTEGDVTSTVTKDKVGDLVVTTIDKTVNGGTGTGTDNKVDLALDKIYAEVVAGSRTYKFYVKQYHLDMLGLFDSYKENIAFTADINGYEVDNAAVTANDVITRDPAIHKVELQVENWIEAKMYLNNTDNSFDETTGTKEITAKTFSIKANAIGDVQNPAEQVTVKVNVVITDVWGRVMTYPVEFTIHTEPLS